MNTPEPTDAEMQQARNTVALRNLCEITKEIAGSLYGQVLPQTQVVDLCTRIEAVEQHLDGKITLLPPNGSPSTTLSPPSNKPPCSDCGSPYPHHRKACTVLEEF